MLVDPGFGAPWPSTGIMQSASRVSGNNSPIAWSATLRDSWMARAHDGKPGVPGLKLPIPEDKYLQLPHPQIAVSASCPKGNVMLHR